MNATMHRALSLGLLALAAQACATARPVVSVHPTSTASAAADTARVYAMGEVTTPPVFTNVPDAVALMARNHPPLLRDTGRGGLVVLRVRVGREGRVVDARVHRTSGDSGMDATALRAAARLRGRAARVGNTPVAVEVEIPFAFGIAP